jgi:hypothetical protein
MWALADGLAAILARDPEAARAVVPGLEDALRAEARAPHILIQSLAAAGVLTPPIAHRRRRGNYGPPPSGWRLAPAPRSRCVICKP